MAKVVKTVRNNWKKSVFGAVLAAYGVNYGLNELEINKNMRIVCEKAAIIGDKPAQLENPKRITVILNPAANKRKAKKDFENYCAPLLHLAGNYVSVIETEKEGHGREIASRIDPQTDAIIVAGGDGTLSEVITGLMRHQGELCKVPIGVLPLGKTNTLARSLYGSESVSTYNGLAKAAMTVINGNTKTVDAMRIEIIKDNDEPAKAPVYGLAGIEWGLWREVKKRVDSFWYLGPLKKYAPLVFHGNVLDKEVEASIRYTKPCSGCSKCYTQRPDLMPDIPQNKGPSRWWNVLSLQNRRLQTKGLPTVDYSKIINDECTAVEEVALNGADLSVITSNYPEIKLEDGRPHILLSLAPKIRYQGELFFDGLKVLNEGKPVTSKIEAKQIEIRPKIESQEENLSIDSEDYEIRPIRVTVLPNAVKVFCP